MYCVYVLRSQKDNLFYTGFTADLNKRIEEHNNKSQFATRQRIPFQLVYYEGCLNKKDAIIRERYLKSGMGKKYIKNRLKYHSLESDKICNT